MESWHSILKKELIYCNPPFKTPEEAYTAIYQYIEFYYNGKRMHSALCYLSPARFAMNLRTDPQRSVYFFDIGPTSLFY
ncbi:IS3 family transposase [Paenibacillus sp. CF095]|uniref:IS3 family transposase n=1 Tax=Paenibacillus sp. CF095 TaxID=1881033 RepID=UPI000B8A11CE